VTVEKDQHFLIDQKVIEQMIDAADLGSDDVVIDVGAGAGSITEKLAGKCRATAIEIEPGFAEKLRALNAKVIIGDARKELGKLAFDKIVANIPFMLAEPLMHTLIRKEFKAAVIIVPKNFFLKAKDNPVFKAFFEMQKIADVGAKAFEPAPDTDCVIMKITKKQEADDKDRIVREIYFQRDKKLKNSLREAIVRAKACTKRKAAEIVNALNLGEDGDKLVTAVSPEVLERAATKAACHEAFKSNKAD